MNEHNICHQGIVKEILGNTLFIMIERNTACANFGQKNEMIQATTPVPETFYIGEVVQVHIKPSLGNKAVVIAYLCPFAVLIMGLFITYYLTKNELFSIGIAFAATTLYFLFIKKMDNKLKKQFSFEVSKIF